MASAALTEGDSTAAALWHLPLPSDKRKLSKLTVQALWLALHTRLFTTDSSRLRFVLLSLRSCTCHCLGPSLTQLHWLCRIMQHTGASPFIGAGKTPPPGGQGCLFGSQSGLRQTTVLQNKKISLALKRNKQNSPQKRIKKPKVLEE